VHVALVLGVGGDDRGDDLGLVAVALGEQRAAAPVHQTGGQRLLLGQTALAPEVAPGDAARRVQLLLVLDREGEEVDVLLLLRADRGDQDDGVAVAHRDRTVGLLGELAGLENQLLLPDADALLEMHVTSSLLSGTDRCGVGGPGALTARNFQSLTAAADALGTPVGGSERKPETPLRVGTGDAGAPCSAGAVCQTAVATSGCQALDELAVPVVVLRLEVIEQPPTLADELQEPPPAVEVLLVRLEVLGEHVDALGEQRHLHLGRAGIGLVGAVLLDDGRLALAENCHVR
jgi:hypothetical protein